MKKHIISNNKINRSHTKNLHNHNKSAPGAKKVKKVILLIKEFKWTFYHYKSYNNKNIEKQAGNLNIKIKNIKEQILHNLVFKLKWR